VVKSGKKFPASDKKCQASDKKCQASDKKCPKDRSLWFWLAKKR